MCASSLRTEITTSFTRQRNLRAQVGELGQRILEARQNLTDLRTGIVRSVADGTALPSVGVPDAANGAPTDEKKSAAGAGFGLGPGAGQLGYGVTPMQDAIKTGAHKKLRGILRTAGASEDEIEEELSHLY